MDEVERALEHFGVKGMKWGVRRRRSASGTESRDSTRSRELGKKVRRGGTKSLSNDEFQEVLNRMNLEARYTQLQGQTRGGRVEKMINDVLDQNDADRFRAALTS